SGGRGPRGPASGSISRPQSRGRRSGSVARLRLAHRISRPLRSEYDLRPRDFAALHFVPDRRTGTSRPHEEADDAERQQPEPEPDDPDVGGEEDERPP